MSARLDIVHKHMPRDGLGLGRPIRAGSGDVIGPGQDCEEKRTRLLPPPPATTIFPRSCYSLFCGSGEDLWMARYGSEE